MVYGFPGDVLISVNDEVVHGIPGARVIEPGDLVKLDVTVEKDGYMADAAVTVAVPPAPERARRLADCARAAFAKAMEVARVGNRVNDIGRAVEDEVHRRGFRVLRDLNGHGIGRTIHEEPSVPNYYDPRTNQLLTERPGDHRGAHHRRDDGPLGGTGRWLDGPHRRRRPGRALRADAGDHPRQADPADGGVRALTRRGLTRALPRLPSPQTAWERGRGTAARRMG